MIRDEISENVFHKDPLIWKSILHLINTYYIVVMNLITD